MEELDITVVTKRSIRGVFAFVSRTFFIQIVGLVVNFLLTIFLSPSVFGVFFVVSAIIAFLSYFSDIGLAAALIQKKESLTDEDLKTTFTIQQILVTLVVVIAFILSTQVKSFYGLGNDGVFLFQALIIAFFLSSLKTIPSILLERNLEFQKLVIPQIVETLSFNIVVLLMAIKGFGAASFAYAVLARSISGLITIYFIAPWKIQIGFSRKVAKKLLSFGIPFQTNSILALIKDDLLTVYLGRIIPIAQVGYIGFAQKWAYMPLRLIMDNIIRITFPSFSRMAHDVSYLRKAIEKTLFVVTLFTIPAFFGLIILSPYFMEIFPKYQKWQPALLSLIFFAINGVLSSISTPLTNTLNAIGKIKITLYLMIFWTVSTWVLTPLAIYFFGFNGVSGVSAVIALSAFVVIIVVRRYVYFDIIIIFLSCFFFIPKEIYIFCTSNLVF
ncbi:MAG: oligosaccharide flippase family protein [Candidatus Levybacteria bacterium]|nr:oligosaccharide flippase family protein [Candidatus Levybacteria bacterium]